jgi:tetratricopeptide (TPR) repeat protein
VTFSPDGTRLAFPGPDGAVRIADGRPWGPELQIEQEAVDLVDGLFARPLLKDAVRKQILGHKTIGEPVRRLALELADRYSDEPERFERAARNVVRHRDVALGVYQLALGWAQTACRLAPEDGKYLTTLGIAQYRNGRHADALTTLLKADGLNKGSRPADVAFLAMTQHHLGHADEAKATLARLQQLLKQPANADAESLAFTAEAEELLQSPALQKVR